MIELINKSVSQGVIAGIERAIAVSGVNPRLDFPRAVLPKGNDLIAEIIDSAYHFGSKGIMDTLIVEPETLWSRWLDRAIVSQDMYDVYLGEVPTRKDYLKTSQGISCVYEKMPDWMDGEVLLCNSKKGPSEIGFCLILLS